MGTDARVLATGFDSLDHAAAVAAQVRDHTMGPTERTPLGSHRRVTPDPRALVWSVESYCDHAGTPVVEVSTGLRWQPDPHEHRGLNELLDVCAAALPGLPLFYTHDEATSHLRFGDATLQTAAAVGNLVPLTATGQAAPADQR